MSVEAQSDIVVRPIRRLKQMVRLRQLWRGALARFSSSLTRRIIVLNLGGLFALLLGFLYLNQFRAGLIDARLQSLQIQGEIIASAIASSATVETDSIAIDPEKLLQLAPGQSYGPSDEASPSLEFSINPDRIGPLLHRLVSPTRTRARVYDRDGYMLLDSRSLTSRSLIVPSDLPPAGGKTGFWADAWAHIKGLYGSSGQGDHAETAHGDGRAYPEIARALAGAAASIVRVNNRGETVVSVAVPIQRFRAVRGALLLSTQGGDIDKIIASERWAIVRIFLVSASVMLLLSLFFAGTIAEPIRKLAEAAERVRRGGKARHEIPDFSDRSDEIGHLSAALRDMTGSLYLRIEAIESFAADVAHELKNPLTSLRSAVETLPIAKTDQSRKRLLEVIEHDVRRLDRLISDISDASRLDAELARFDMAEVDLSALLQAVVDVAQSVERGDEVRVVFEAEPAAGAPRPWRVLGHDSRLSQVLNNLIDNARSFSEHGDVVHVRLKPARGPGANGTREGFEIIVDDNGPGIPAHAFERIFERFYTDRPNHGFGQNSGLGLSISRQIVEAHNGRIRAMNRPDPHDPEQPLGARFSVWLPAAAR
ncbi:MAG: stimulus-sensing domain-containing protein [Rhodoblastus sp.]